ncbi:unnamed protein product [Effrenium voratum]|nr:unnamed protein product [Effrenium voratum]
MVFSGSQRGKEALRLLFSARARGLVPSVVLSSSAAYGAAETSLWEEAAELLAEMGRWGPQPNKFTYAAVMQGLTWEAALMLPMADAVCLGAAVASQACGAAWEAAFALINSARRCQQKPNVIMYSSLMTAYQKAVQWESTLTALRAPSNVVTLSAALSALEKRLRWAEALQLLVSFVRRQVEAEEVRSALRSAGARLRAGDDWFVLSMRWWDLWKDYTHFAARIGTTCPLSLQFCYLAGRSEFPTAKHPK